MELEGKIMEHNLHQRLDECAKILATDPTNEAALDQLEIIDNEVTQFQRFAEKRCRKIYSQPLAFSLPHRLAPAIWPLSYILQSTYVGTQIVRISSGSNVYCIWLYLFSFRCN